MSYEQIAVDVGISVRTLMRWLSHAGYQRPIGGKIHDRPSPRFQAVFDLIDQGMSCRQASKIIGMPVNKACDAWARFRPMTPLQRGRRGGLAAVPDLSHTCPTPHPAGHGRPLSATDRVLIAYLVNTKSLSARATAQQLGCQPSTVSREIKRNSVDGFYNPLAAQQLADERRKRPKVRKLDRNVRLRREVIRLMCHTYSNRISVAFPAACRPTPSRALP